jgi:hypothetical protein
MENLSYYSSFLKGILDANPWIWHTIQVFLLFVFLAQNTSFLKRIEKSIIIVFGSTLQPYIIILLVFIYCKMAFWGILIFILINLSYNFITEKLDFKKNIRLFYFEEIFAKVLIASSIFAIDNSLELKYKIALLVVWVIHLQQVIFITINSFKYSKRNDIEPDKIGASMLYLSPLYIALFLVPNPWYFWMLILLGVSFKRSSYPNFFLTNGHTLIDNWKKSNNKYVILIPSMIVFFYLGFTIHSYLFIGFMYFIPEIVTFLSPRSLLSSPIRDYDSYTLITGNYNYLNSIVASNKLLLLVQRISIKLSDKFTYGILVSPYEEVVVEHNSIKKVSELAPFSHHLILMDGGEDSDKIIKIEHDLNYFLGRVDSVIDYFTIANQSIDEYSTSINEDYAQCIRNRIAIKQSIIDEKSIELIEKTNEESITIDRFINSINTESVRINMLVRDYSKDSKLDYYQLQKELINKGPFEINTLLRQMREGGSIPSRFVDALSIAEVSARYLFSLMNEVTIYLDKNENSIQDRNTKYGQLSFGPCVGFLRTITEKGKLNAFEKSIKELLKTKYSDIDNSIRLKKYLINDLHYDKVVKEEPTLFDLFNYMAYIRNKTRGHGTPSKVEFDFYVTLDLISIFIVHCISKIEVETFSRQIINDKEWLLYYNAGGNVILHPLDSSENLDYWKDSFDWNYLDKMEEAKKHLEESNQSVYFKIKYQEEIHWIKSEAYFKCKEGIIYIYDGINKDEAEWISFTTGAVIRPYRIN